MSNSTTNLPRLFEKALESVHHEWSKSVFDKLGSRIQRALLAEEILHIAGQQEKVDLIASIVQEGRIWIYEEAGSR